MLWSRVVQRLRAAEARETDPWLRDDIKIARLTVVYAASGEAVCCTPHVLATYKVLGIHPDKVWPAIQERRKAQGPVEAIGAPPKRKPAQSVKLWPEKIIGARAANSRAGDVTVLREPTISVPMAAPSIAALYPNSGEQSTGKTRQFSYDELLVIIRKSFAPPSVVSATVNALTARGRWPKRDGAVDGVICVSLNGMMLGGPDGDRNVVRSTARWRARRAVKLGYWRQLRDPNSWSNCPKCQAVRKVGTCEKCGYKGRAKTPDGKANFDEFCRPYMYEIDIDKFRHAPPAKGIRHFNHRTYQDHKQAAKRGEHPNVTEFPKPEPPSTSPPKSPAPAKPASEPERKTAERTTPELGSRAAERLHKLRIGVSARMTQLMKGGMTRDAAIQETCRDGGLAPAEVEEILKLCCFKPPAVEKFKTPDPPKCKRCRDLKKVLNPPKGGPGERWIDCPDCMGNREGEERT